MRATRLFISMLFQSFSRRAKVRRVKRRTMVAPRAEPLKSLLIRELGVTSSAADRLLERGAVYVDGKRVAEGRVLADGARVTVVLEESGAATDVPISTGLEAPTLFEDADIIAVNKPAGLPSQPTPGGAISLHDVVSQRLGFAAGLVHRLDRETSGVTVFGKHARATTRLAAAFREGTVRKRYLAVTGPGLPEKGSITLPLSKDPSRPGRWRASDKANGVSAHTDFERLWSSADFCLVSLTPLTGRTHQLRAHLTSVGYPIVGDTLYGGGGDAARCLLHAHQFPFASAESATCSGSGLAHRDVTHSKLTRRCGESSLSSTAGSR